MVYFAKWKVVLVLLICVLGLVYASPNLLGKQTANSLPSWLPNQQISLGLDLRGGAHLLYEVEVDAVIEERLEGVVDGIRAGLREARIRYRGLGLDGPHGVKVQIVNAEEVSQARDIVREAAPDMDLATEEATLKLGYTEQALSQQRVAALEQTIEIVRRRIDEKGVLEPSIQRQGEDRVLIQLPGVDPAEFKRIINRTARMTFQLVDEEDNPGAISTGRAPPGTQLLPMSDGTGQILVKRRVMVSGENLVNAAQNFDSQTNQPVVSFRFDTLGAKRFGNVTSKNVGRRFAIVLDGKVISAPVIREAILGGSGQISGGFTVTEAQDLALLLRAGALPAPLVIIEERSIGPSLGADSIASGRIAAIVGLIAVVVFMGLYYGLFGLIADVALIFNIVLIGAALSVLQATLTLPGIAGIVLTIGMAVDANVLVFERIREEVRSGRTPISAIDAGYRQALSTIVDANVTTLIAAILLYIFGSGPVRGFAVTLAIGIVTSMFTALMVTRLLVVTWLRAKKPDSLPI